MLHMPFPYSIFVLFRQENHAALTNDKVLQEGQHRLAGEQAQQAQESAITLPNVANHIHVNAVDGLQGSLRGRGLLDKIPEHE